MECVEKIIKKDWINPLDSTKLTEADIISLQRVIIKCTTETEEIASNNIDTFF